MCEVLDVSCSDFYAWNKRPESKRTFDDRRYTAFILNCFKRSRETYGYRGIHKELESKGEHSGKHQVARLMRTYQTEAI